MSPDFPTPDTMTLPFASASRRTARANSLPSRRPVSETAAASIWSTRRPAPINSGSSSRTGGLLRKVAGQRFGPVTAGAEKGLTHFAHGAMTTGSNGDVRRHRFNLRHRIGHGNRQPDPSQQGQVGEIVTDEGSLLPLEATTLKQVRK